MLERAGTGGAVLTREEIRSKAQTAVDAFRMHDAKRKVLEAELLCIQHVCTHPNEASSKHYDYGGGCDVTTTCPDCLRSVTR